MMLSVYFLRGWLVVYNIPSMIINDTKITNDIVYLVMTTDYNLLEYEFNRHRHSCVNKSNDTDQHATLNSQ